jgi:hypothetical protein
VCGEKLKLVEVGEMYRHPFAGNDYDGECEHNYEATPDLFWVCTSGDSTHGTWTTTKMRDEAIKALEGWLGEVRAAALVVEAEPKMD